MKKPYTYTLSSMFLMGAIVFIGLPFLAQMFPADKGQPLFMLALLIINPFFSIISGYLYTRTQPFTWYMPLGIMILFIPVILIFLNISAVIYIPLYGISNAIGCGIGYWIQKR